MRSRLIFVSVLVAASCVHARERVPVHFDIPKGLEAYSGVQPVTFGVPFERGPAPAE